MENVKRNTKKTLLFGALVFFGLINVSSAYEFPGKPTGFINDYVGILSDSEKGSLETMLSNFSSQTGNQISIAIVKSLNGDTVENFAEKLFKDWGLGEVDKDNGALLLIALGDRELRVEVGYGLEGSLTDADSYLIIQNLIIPQFKNGDYFLGIKNGILGIISKTSTGFDTQGINVKNNSLSFKNIDPFFLIFFAYIIINLFANILGKSKSWWLGGIFGGGAGTVLGFIFGFLYIGILSIAGLSLVGFLFDYFVSKRYSAYKEMGASIPWWMRGRGLGGGGRFGGGFGGFGGGGSGGGGSSGKW